jgi:molybdenum cofactor biosynthesis enzyme MoaA
MRAQSLLVTRRCNQRCAFCDRVDPASVDPPPALLLREIVRSRESGASSLTITGGEPTLRPDLVEIVRAARSRGFSDITLATNATRIVPAAAAALRQAGLTGATVSVVTTHPDRHRSVVSDTTHPAHVLRGLTALLDAGLRVTVRLPVARDVPPAAARLHGLKQAVPRLDRFTLAAIGPGEATLRPEQTLSTEELAAELTAAYDASEKLHVTLTLDPEHPVAPCAAPLPPRARRLFASVLREENGPPNRASAACDACGLAPSCTVSAEQLARSTGPQDRHGSHVIRPIADAAAFSRPGRSPGARLRVLGKEDVEKFFVVHYDYGKEVAVPTSRIGILYRCNQVCTFCELADMDTEVPPERVRAAIDEAAARGSIRVIVTGGEPTLSRHLVDHVQYAKDRGLSIIELQTNAVLLDDPAFARALAAAGLTSAQISLHGPDATISDRLTAAPGTHARTLRGVGNLLEAGVRCLLNHLIFRDNMHLLGDFVEMVHERWGAHRHNIVLQFHSPRNEFSRREDAMRHVAKYSEYAHLLRRAIDRARELGIPTHDLQDPTGIPALCVLGADEAYLGRIAAQAERPRFHAWESDWLTHVEKCRSCDLLSSCMGIPKPYLALFGDAEFVPIRRTTAGAEHAAGAAGTAGVETSGGEDACSAPR